MLKRLKEFFGDFKNQKRYFRWMLEYSKKYIWAILLIILLDAIMAFVSVGSSVASKYVIDLATGAGKLSLGIILMISLTGFDIVLGFFSSIYWSLINEKYSFSVRMKLYNSILRTRWPLLTKYKSGDLITRLTSDIGDVTNGMLSTVPTIVALFIQLIAAFAVLYHYDSGLALFALISSPIAFGASVILGARLKTLQVKVQESESAYRSFLHESMNNIIVIKSFGNEEDNTNKLSELRKERFRWVFKRTMMSVTASSVLSIAFSAGYLVAFCIGAYKIHNHLITFGTMTLFLSMVSKIQSPMISLGRNIPRLISVLASAGRIIEISELEQEDRRSGEFKPERVNISLENVSFKYESEYIIKNISLHIGSGEIVAITGRTGAGKTTLIKLLMNFIKPTEGEVTYIDGFGNSENANADSRDYIAYIPQGNYLFSGSIADNLKTGKPDATEEEILEALKCACADDFVSAMPDGINTVIGEKGEGLSEGQGQRIALARAFIRKSPLLILDESTSSLDENTEFRILDAIKNMDYNPTCIIITHRKAAISICDRHFHVEEESIIEMERT